MLTPDAPPPPVLGACTVLTEAGEAVSLGELWAGQATLLWFTRHFGCIGCSEGVSLLAPHLAELARLDVRTVLVGCGAHPFITPFRTRKNLLHAPIECVTDESLAVQRAVGLGYGWWGGFGPIGLGQMARAFTQGHVSGPVEGDPRQQAGAVFLDHRGVVRLVHRSRTLGDHPKPDQILRVALAAWLAAHPGQG